MTDAFISYSRHDGAEAALLVAHLRHNQLEPWLDTDDQISAGSRWRDEVARAIEEAACLVVVITPHALASKEVAREVEHTDR